jgi:hypothetical protein
MRLTDIVGYSVASLALPLAAFAGSAHSAGHVAKRHHDLAQRSGGNFTFDLEKRQGQTFGNARFTFYDAGLYVDFFSLLRFTRANVPLYFSTVALVGYIIPAQTLYVFLTSSSFHDIEKVEFLQIVALNAAVCFPQSLYHWSWC